jgi:hypothetical protein
MPVVAFSGAEPPVIPMLNLILQDPDGDIDDWGLQAWLQPDASLAPVFAAGNPCIFWALRQVSRKAGPSECGRVNARDFAAAALRSVKLSAFSRMDLLRSGEALALSRPRRPNFC